MKKFYISILSVLFLTACGVDTDKSDSTSNTNGQVYTSSSESAITTTVDEELENIEQSGTASGFSL